MAEKVGRWSPEEDAALRAAWPRWRKMRQALRGRSRQSIAKRAARLGLRCARREKRAWTPEDDALLASRWGEDAGKTLVLKLRRSETAIYLRARRLGLGRQDRGRTHVTPLARRLGLDEPTLYRLLDECGLSATFAAPVRESKKRGVRYRTRVTDGEAAEACMKVRDGRTSSLSAWGRSEGVLSGTVLRWARRAGISPAYGSKQMVRYPTALLDELRTGAGIWHTIWREIMALPAEDREAAPWCLALAAYDTLFVKRDGRDWVEQLAGQVITQVRKIARRIRLGAMREAA